MFYANCHEEWYQGDILASFPFVVSDLTSTNSGKSLKLFDKPAIIISQTCDIQRKDFVQVCPVHDFDHLKSQLMRDGKSEQSADDALDSVRRGNTEARFYLPQEPSFGMKEGYADLNFICTVSRKQLMQLNRIVTLNDHPRQVFAYFVSNLFLKPHFV